jgi:tyrosyl-tRNA synthetase
MSKSLGNYIGFTEPPEDIYGKVMSISDPLMFRYWELLTDMPPEERAAMQSAVASGAMHPMTLKHRLAHRLVEDFHGGEAAAQAADHFARVHQRREIPEEIEEIRLDLADAMNFASALVETHLAPSKSEARRLVKSGAVTVDGQKVTDPTALLPPRPFVLRCGKLRFVRIT